jgi:hypothetical protein
VLTIKERPETRPRSFGSVSVPGTRAGAIVSLGLVILAWIAIPVARPFILGTVGLGAVVALILQRKHNKL